MRKTVLLDFYFPDTLKVDTKCLINSVSNVSCKAEKKLNSQVKINR